MGLNRADLETLNWQIGGDGEVFWVEELAPLEGTDQLPSSRQLQAASPELALACLEAKSLFQDIWFKATNAFGFDRELADSCAALIRALDAALALAGVEVG